MFELLLARLAEQKVLLPSGRIVFGCLAPGVSLQILGVQVKVDVLTHLRVRHLLSANGLHKDKVRVQYCCSHTNGAHRGSRRPPTSTPETLMAEVLQTFLTLFVSTAITRTGRHVAKVEATTLRQDLKNFGALNVLFLTVALAIGRRFRH